MCETLDTQVEGSGWAVRPVILPIEEVVDEILLVDESVNEQSVPLAVDANRCTPRI